MSNFDDFLGALNPSVFEEVPVDIDTFLYDKQYMGRYMNGVTLSPIQRQIVELGSQVFNLKTLTELHGRQKAERIWKATVRNVLLMLGKGSGKDFTARLMVIYAVYKLLCLRDPQGYFNRPFGDPIDIINMALNSPQAKTVFFDPLVRAIKSSPWFEGRYEARSNDIAFDKEITIYSLHSSFEAAEGKNIIIGVLDEIDGFTVEGYAAEVWDAISATVTTRFPDIGKLIALSFPRTKEGFMMSMYNEAVDEVEVETFEHTFVINENVDPEEEGNSFTVTWTEDTVLSYKRDNFFALKAPTFRVNPTVKIENFKDSFYRDLKNNDTDTLMRVCANPPDHDETSFIQNHERVEETFAEPNGWQGDDVKCLPVPDAEYYIHVDLSKVSDRTVVALGHVSHWVEPEIHARVHTDSQPFIKIDLFRVWEPSRLKPVDDAEVMDFIMLLCKKFNVRKVTFDQWNSFDNINYLNGVGVEAEKNSLKREEYMEFRTAMYEKRMSGPYDERLWKELKNLIITKVGKVDHPVGKEHYNDISEAICGVTVNCIRNTFRDTELEVLSLDSFSRDELTFFDDPDTFSQDDKPEMPGYIADILEGWKLI